jgi:hypothetical protein
MILIQASEKALSFNGDSQTALYLVNDLRESYQANGMDMPKMLNDFVFNIEVALQNAGVLDEWFEENLAIDLDGGLSAINEGAEA